MIQSEEAERGMQAQLTDMHAKLAASEAENGRLKNQHQEVKLGLEAQLTDLQMQFAAAKAELASLQPQHQKHKVISCMTYAEVPQAQEKLVDIRTGALAWLKSLYAQHT